MLAAAEAAVGLAIVLAIFQTFKTIDVRARGPDARVTMEHANVEVVEHAAALGRLAVHHVSYLWLIPLFPVIGAAINALVRLRSSSGSSGKKVDPPASPSAR